MAGTKTSICMRPWLAYEKKKKNTHTKNVVFFQMLVFEAGKRNPSWFSLEASSWFRNGISIPCTGERKKTKQNKERLLNSVSSHDAMLKVLLSLSLSPDSSSKGVATCKKKKKNKPRRYIYTRSSLLLYIFLFFGSWWCFSVVEKAKKKSSKGNVRRITRWDLKKKSFVLLRVSLFFFSWPAANQTLFVSCVCASEGGFLKPDLVQFSFGLAGARGSFEQTDRVEESGVLRSTPPEEAFSLFLLCNNNYILHTISWTTHCRAYYISRLHT